MNKSNRNIFGYATFFLFLFAGFILVIYSFSDFFSSGIPVLNNDVKDFSFTDQNGRVLTQNSVEGKVYVAAFFFTTCNGICPRMNANMRFVYDAYKNENDFLILSHTCMPEKDSVPVLKEYEARMLYGITGKEPVPRRSEEKNLDTGSTNKNWFFLTGDKEALYKMARVSYLIDDNKKGHASQAGPDVFLHTQFFALVDRQRRVRKIYDGLKMNEIKELIGDIKELLKEKKPSRTL